MEPSTPGSAHPLLEELSAEERERLSRLDAGERSALVGALSPRGTDLRKWGVAVAAVLAVLGLGFRFLAGQVLPGLGDSVDCTQGREGLLPNCLVSGTLEITAQGDEVLEGLGAVMSAQGRTGADAAAYAEAFDPDDRPVTAVALTRPGALDEDGALEMLRTRYEGEASLVKSHRVEGRAYRCTTFAGTAFSDPPELVAACAWEGADGTGVALGQGSVEAALGAIDGARMHAAGR